MDYLKRKRVKNAGHPKGFWGRKTMRAMNRGHDKLTDWGLSFLPVNGEDKVLDIGCGGGRTVNKLAKATANTVWGVDISTTAINEAFRTNRKEVKQDHVILCKADVAALPFDNDTFDVVTAVETIYFWPNPLENLKEVCRVMKPGGHLMILTEARADGPHPEKWAEIAKLIDMRIPTADGLADELKAAGFGGITAYIKDDALCLIAQKGQKGKSVQPEDGGDGGDHR